MNQGPRRISLMKKNGGKKSRGTIPLRPHFSGRTCFRRLIKHKIPFYKMLPTCPSKLRQTAPRRRTSWQPPGSATNSKGFYGLKTILSSPFQSDIPPPHNTIYFSCALFSVILPLFIAFIFLLIRFVWPWLFFLFFHIFTLVLFFLLHIFPPKGPCPIYPPPPRGDPIFIYM